MARDGGTFSDNTGLVTQFSTTVWERLTNDTGSNSDLITNDPSLTGSGVANAVVHFTVDGSPISDTAVADGSGMWDFTPIGLGQGAHTIVASETDTAGNTRTDSLTFTLDTIAPSSAITSETLNSPAHRSYLQVRPRWAARSKYMTARPARDYDDGQR